ncbi:MAG: hypothetical protein AB7H93_05315 [Vicinamibacterales bacterium]
MTTDLVVSASALLAAAFVLAWAVSPRLRSWIERPNHAFLDAVRRYDRDTRAERERTTP